MTKTYRSKLLNEIEIRGLAESTKKSYIRAMELFIEFHKGKSPAKLNIEDVKTYQGYLVKGKKLGPHTVNKEISAIRFFYRNILNRAWYDKAIPRMKAKRKLPIVLTQEEVMSMINVVENIFWKALIMLMYSTGLRQGEVRKLKKGDIDSKRMVIHVRDGKGGKGRQALLSPKVLKCLRQYWRERRLNNPVESDYLFIPTKNSHSGKLAKKLSHTAVGYIVARVAKLAGIKKKFTHIFCVTPLQLIF